MFYSIQACRILAALLVVMFHATVCIADERYFGELGAPLKKFFQFGGDAGVAFFFVLSGFIIHHAHAQDLNNPRRLWYYIRKRLTRIYPGYLIIFCTVFTVAYALPSLRDTVPHDVGVIAKAMLLLPQDAGVIGGTGAPVIIVAWSLWFEMLFYLAFALAICDLRAAYILVGAYSILVLFEPLFGPYAFPLSFISSHLIFLFLLGVGSSIVSKRWQRSTIPNSMALGAIGAFVLISILRSTLPIESLPKLYTDLGYGISSAILVFALVDKERRESTPKRWNSIVIFLGNASYALYLIHYPAISLIAKAAIRIVPVNYVGALTALGCMLIGTVLIAAAFFHVVERPILNLLRGKARSGAPTLTTRPT